MGSVLNSVKKKRKYKRKTADLSKSEPDIMNISNKLSNNLSIGSPIKNNSELLIKFNGEDLKCNDNDLDDYNENEKKNYSHKSPAESTRSHKIEANSDLDISKVNAFDLLMNARNQSIGLNTFGKEYLIEEKLDIEESKDILAKRKILFEEWAERKGGQKRKLKDLEQEEYIQRQLNKRAKRLKHMLINCKNKSSSESPTYSSEAESVPKRKKRKNICDADSPDIEKTNLITEDNLLETKIPKDLTFIQKLASPIKKRDSLLGYFQKVNVSNQDLSFDNKKEGKKNRKKSRKLVENKTKENDLQDPLTTSSGRPRRSCTRKPAFDYDLAISVNNSNNEVITIESSETIHLLKQSGKEEIDDIIDLDSIAYLGNNNKENIDNVPSYKLAPLFMKTTIKPIIDSETVKARQDFLMSGIPNKMKLEIDRQKSYEQRFLTATEIFPTVSHIFQLEEKDYNFKSVISSKIKWRQKKSDNNREFLNNEWNFTSLLKSDDLKNVIKHKTLGDLVKIENKADIIKNFKNQYDKFPTYKCYNQIREKYNSFIVNELDLQTKRLSKSVPLINKNRIATKSKVNTKNKGIESPTYAPNGDFLFTEKYKPLTSQQVVVNLHPVNQLKDFLSSWQNATTAKCNLEFCETDNSSNSCSNTYNSVVLVGPCSSGKTSTVFALANEMNFKVIEVNAGMKRTGKKIVQYLQEATQSHQVGKNKNPLKTSKYSFEKIKKDNNNLSSSAVISSEVKSLILIEDADILFEQDSGFIDAIHHLAMTSKRPVIITSNNITCPHLSKFINYHFIEFHKPNVLNISKFLSIISLIENCPTEINDIMNLYLYNKKDLRKTLLEMQFFIQSGGDRGKPEYRLNENKFVKEEYYIHNQLYGFYTKNQNLILQIPAPIDCTILRENLAHIFKCSRNLFSEKQNKGRHREYSKKPTDRVKNKIICKDSIDHIANFYENISVMNLIQPNDQHQQGTYFRNDIMHTLVEKALVVNLDSNFGNYNLSPILLERRSLFHYLPLSCNKNNRSIALDYDPCLRNICRSEKFRSTAERRGSRFYHYLRNKCDNIDTFSCNIFENSCSVLVESMPAV